MTPVHDGQRRRRGPGQRDVTDATVLADEHFGGPAHGAAPRAAAWCGVSLSTYTLFSLVSCVAAPQTRGAGHPLVVHVDGRQVFSGSAAYTVRVGSQHASRVVSLRGLGEILVDDDACRYAHRGTDGALSVWQHDGPCTAPLEQRLCFRHVAFVDERDVQRVVVDGCADQNELFLDRIDSAIVDVGVGPRTLIERCVDVPARAPSYLRVVEIAIDGNEQPWRGVRLRHDGDAFGVCFLSMKTGRYRVEVVVEDPHRRTLQLAGDVDEL